MKISASLMCGNLPRLADELEELEQAGVDWLHFDIMDGRFVPNLTFGPDIVAALRPLSELPFDVHLMIEEPIHYLEAFADAGADMLVVHVEAGRHIQRTLTRIRELGATPGVALNPDTPLAALDHILDDVDMVLVMTVNPGFAGQTIVPATIPKVAALAERLRREGREIIIEVDGNITPENGRRLAEAGATAFVAGTGSVFAPGVSRAEGARLLREAIEAGARKRAMA